MPATEQSWRNINTLHVIFGISSLALLVTTLWMFAQDHLREWKGVQKLFYDRIEPSVTRFRETEELAMGLRQTQTVLEGQLRLAKMGVPLDALDTDDALADLRTRQNAFLAGMQDSHQQFTAEAEQGGDTSALESLSDAFGAWKTKLTQVAEAAVEVETARLANAPAAAGSAGGESATPAAPDQGTTDEVSTDRAAAPASQSANVLQLGDEAIALRDTYLQLADAIVKKAKFVETRLLEKRKFRRADLDVAVSVYSLAVGENAPAQRQAELDAAAHAIRNDVQGIDLSYQQASSHRKSLEATLANLRGAEKAAQESLNKHLADYQSLETALSQQLPNPGKSLLRGPILDAFNTGNVRINQIWLPSLEIDLRHAKVARFDRCTTCHLAIDRGQPGKPTDPLFPAYAEFQTSLTLPEEAPPEDDTATASADGDASANSAFASYLKRVYGLVLAEEGLISDEDVTVAAVLPNSLAALAGLRAGDIIVQARDAQLHSLDEAEEYLMEAVEWGQTLQLTIGRGLKQPYSAHPRLDLFVGPTSPHSMEKFGCTICHDGQGSATEFKWTSHTPNDYLQQMDWSKEHHWFNNHFWEMPMKPERMQESNCVRCHHEVVDLAPSAKFPDPPAPKLVKGFETIREFGCFGCHEINGYDGPNRRVGPDMRVEPNYAAAAAQLLNDPGLSEEDRGLAERIVKAQQDSAARTLLAEHVLADKNLANAAPSADAEAPAAPTLSPASHVMGEILAATPDVPGKLTKVGPSLRYVKSKVDEQFLYNWIANPTDFRPSTKMPRFFGLHNHLKPHVPGESADHASGEHGEPASGGHAADTGGHAAAGSEVAAVEEDSPGYQESLRYEPVEIRSIVHYLLTASQPFTYRERAAGISEEPSAERGKKMFQVRGCLACHKHADFSDSIQTQGPDLSRLGSKLTMPDAENWLYSWLRQPNAYHPRTVMPDTFLEPIVTPASMDGATPETVTDPAADLVVYLLGSKGWTPQTMPEIEESAVDELVVMHLSGSGFSKERAQRFAAEGVTPELAGSVNGDARTLLLSEEQASLQGNALADVLFEKKVRYLGQRTISKYGCSACHDIPGFEDAKPIGTGLADWGKKDVSQLAFEQIVQYLEETDPDAAHAHGDHKLFHVLKDMPADKSFFIEKLLTHQREGFIWQKLREPRSYDFKKTEHKSYNDRLRMPQFNFTPEQVEAIVTFVLGLTADPPAEKYVYQPKPREKAIVEGRHVLEKYNCAGCHALELETWKFDYNPSDFPESPEFNDYAFLMPHFSPEAVQASAQTDNRGLGTTTVHGLPQIDETGALINAGDEENPLYSFTPWASQPINGQVWLAGIQDVPVALPSLVRRHDSQGGYLARLLYPVAFEDERAVNPNVKTTDVWGWLPPPLEKEGIKVRPDWLHAFLLDPQLIRPAVILRMPNFHMTEDEATKLVDYFAAMDGAEYPYEFNPRNRPEYLASAESATPERMDMALNLVTNNNLCVKCHYVGDFVPAGSPKAHAPNLDQVYQRIRPEFLRDWVANPKMLLPYTGMPVNFPPDKPAPQELYPGSSEEQLQAVVDFLLNYDDYMKRQKSIRPLVQPAAPATDAGAEEATGN